MAPYIAVVQKTEDDSNLDNQSITLLRIYGVRALAVFSSRRVCEDFIEEYPVEVDGIRAVPWECNWPELLDLAELIYEGGELIYEGGIRFVVFDPEMISDSQWATELAPMDLGDYRRLMAKILAMAGEVTSGGAPDLADRTPCPDHLLMEIRSSISSLKKILDDMRARVEELEI